MLFSIKLARPSLVLIILSVLELFAGVAQSQACKANTKCPVLPQTVPAYPDFECGYQKLELKAVYFGKGTISWYCDPEGPFPSPDIQSSKVDLYDVGTPLKATGQLVPRLKNQQSFDTTKYKKVGTVTQGDYGFDTTLALTGAAALELEEKYSTASSQREKNIDWATFQPPEYSGYPVNVFVYRVRTTGGANLAKRPDGSYYPCETPRPITAEYWVYGPKGKSFNGFNKPLCTYV